MSIIAMNTTNDGVPESLMRRYDAARARRRDWETLWAQSDEYALPQRNGMSGAQPGARQTDRL